MIKPKEDGLVTQHITTRQTSAFSPFKHSVFTVMWVAALISNIGTWMHSVGAAWLMTSLSPSPLVVALVQTASTLPIFLFALPAGALADIFNKRILLLMTNGLMLLAAAVFTLMVWRQVISAPLLLLFTFLLGAGAAFMAPAWQAIIPDLVDKHDLPQAVALGGISINLSRAIGPALAGVLMSTYGQSMPFIANTLSFGVIVLALWWWQYHHQRQSHHLPPERVWSAMKTGLRYARYSQPLKATMWHVAGFMFFAHAFWGLLPIISKHQLQGEATFFGLLTGAIGLGAVAGALTLPRLKMLLSANQLVALGSLGTSVVTGCFAFLTHPMLALVLSLIFGVSWILVLPSVNVSAQQALPDWVRARGLAVYMMVFFGSMSLGAAFWGWFAGMTSIETAMVTAAVGGVAFILLSYNSQLQQGSQLDLSPSNHWPEPLVHEHVKADIGPVIILISYQIAEQDVDAFLKAIARLKAIRRRSGAHKWGVYEDTEQQGLFVEHFMEDSWAEHLRHHERVTLSDKPIQDAVLAFHQGNEAPKVQHLLATHQR